MNELVNYESQITLADKLSKSVMCPHKRGEDALFAIMTGEAIGLHPAVALQNIFNINGAVCMRADMMLALVKRHPQYAGCEINYGQDRCEIVLSRKLSDGTIDMVKTGFGITEATKAGLMGKDNYKKYPDRMYKARALSYACRDLFPDAVWGLMSFEEAVDIDPEEKMEIKYDTMFSKCREMLTTKDLGADENVEAFADMIDQYEKDQDLFAIEHTYKQLKRKPDKVVIASAVEVIDKPQTMQDTMGDTMDDTSQVTHEIKQAVCTVMQSLIDLGIGNYDNEKHRANSIKKHLGTDKVNDCNDAVRLEEYRIYLQDKLDGSGK